MNRIIEKENIENMIYEIRGKQVMLDSDLARLYECKNGTKTITLILIISATGVFKIVANIATPCSVKTYGILLTLLACGPKL